MSPSSAAASALRATSSARDNFCRVCSVSSLIVCSGEMFSFSWRFRLDGIWAALHSGGDGDSVLLEEEVAVLIPSSEATVPDDAASPLLLKEMFWRKTCLLKSRNCLDAVSRMDELPVSTFEVVFWLELEILLPVNEVQDAGDIFRATDRLGLGVVELPSPPLAPPLVAVPPFCELFVTALADT